jgi:mono/diheme cytochrome c family protein
MNRPLGTGTGSDRSALGPRAALKPGRLSMNIRSSNRWRRAGRVVAWVVAGLALVAATGVATGLGLAERKAARRVAVAVRPIAVPDDAASINRGRYLYESRACADCHGVAGGGRRFIDEGSLRLAGPDITSAGRTAAYGAADWVRSVRHGVAPDGRPLRVMPSEDYNRLTDADLGALVAYVRQLPPQRGDGTVIELPFVVRALYGWGALTDAYDRIDHSLPPEMPVAEAATVEHGRYVAQMCRGCHGPGLGGGRIPGSPPDWPAAANLTPAADGAMTRYPDAASFARMMRSGQRPDGSRVAVMPFEALAQLNDTDLEAIRLYLGSVPVRAAGQR